MLNLNPSQQNGGLAYLTPECLDQLCDLIIAKLAERNPWGLASQASLPWARILSSGPIKNERTIAVVSPLVISY